MIITIDGPSGTGKSTVAKLLADRLGFTYFDTGAMYRSFTYLVLESGIDIEDPAALTRLLSEFRYDIRLDGGQRHYFVNDEEVTKAIRGLHVTSKVSEVAAKREVRQRLVETQRQFGHQRDAVFEGRDIGTVVFPEAEAKIFLTASPEERARRRFDQLQEGAGAGDLTGVSVETIQSDIEARDHYDSTREVSPLRQAEDAILIDTSELSIEEVVERIAIYVEQVRTESMT